MIIFEAMHPGKGATRSFRRLGLEGKLGGASYRQNEKFSLNQARKTAQRGAEDKGTTWVCSSS